MARARAVSNGEREVKEDFDALRADLETLRKDFDTLVDGREAVMAQARTASNGGRDAKEDFGALRSDLDTLRKDFGTFVSTLKDNTSSRAGAELDAMRQRIATLASDLQATGQEQVHKVEGKVGERPFVSLAIAFATGIVVGRVLQRR
jgi:ElaB/YqjD/DUF883 family membrane-anchored ribosome-binding protein